MMKILAIWIILTLGHLMEPHSDPVLQADQVQIQQEKTEIDQKELPQKVKEAIIEGKETSTLKISKA